MSAPAPSVCPVAAQVPFSFPVDPADVPPHAVRVVKRTLLRHAPVDPMDDDLARLIVAGVLAVLAEDGAAEVAAALVSRYTLATGAVVTIQAAGG
jgi:hypothetical protein